MSDPPIYYSDYLRLDQLLDAQHPESARHGRPSHDEMLFIIVHQVYELWFKQILHDLEDVMTVFGQPAIDDEEMGRMVARFDRIAEIQRLLHGQLDVLETMTPLDFLEFRDYLIPASGFQSVQFRLIEITLGIRTEDRALINEAPYTSRFRPDHRAQLEEAERRPSLFDRVEAWLERTPFLEDGAFEFWRAYQAAVHRMLDRDRRHIETNPNLTPEGRNQQLKALDATIEHFEALFDPARHTQLVAQGARRLSHSAFLAALLINLYRHEPILQLPFRLLTKLMDIDEGFTAWRYRHALMARRMIGGRIGTGGTSGHEYLRETAERSRVFADLFDLSTFFIPRSELPDLPPEVEQKMHFAGQ